MNREERDFRLARLREKKAELKKQIQEFQEQQEKHRVEQEAELAAKKAQREDKAKTWWGKTKKALDPFHGLEDDVSTGIGLLFDLSTMSSTLPLVAAMERQLNDLEEEEARLLGVQLEDTTKSADEIKMVAARERFKQDIRFQVDLSAGKKLYAHEALQQWKKDERNRILYDQSLTPHEREKLFDALEEAYVEEENRIRTDMAVYEE